MGVDQGVGVGEDRQKEPAALRLCNLAGLYKSQLPVVEWAIEDRRLAAGDGQIPWLLLRDGLRRLPGGSESGE